MLERETLNVLAPPDYYQDELSELNGIENAVRRELKREKKKKVFRFRRLEHINIPLKGRK